MNNEYKIGNIISPCISICRTDPRTGYCYGCSRTDEDKKIWKDKKTSNEWKKKNIDVLKNRMTGWQLETFIESYQNKLKSGVSLFKKNLIQKKVNN